MRLDVFLTRTHLVKRRAQAQEIAVAGQVLINGQPAKAAKNTSIGDQLLIRLPQREMLIEVTELPQRKFSAKAGAAFYRILEDKFANPADDWD